MSSCLYIDNQRVVNLRTVIPVQFGCMCKREKAVDQRNGTCVLLYLRNKISRMVNEIMKDALLNHNEFIFCMKNFLFIHFKFFGDVSLGIDQCLFPYPIRWHLILVGVAYFKVVPEDLVV